MHKYIVESPFAFNQRVVFSSAHANGTGNILDICFGQDMKVYYMIIDEDGDIHGGLDPSDVRLYQSTDDGLD